MPLAKVMRSAAAGAPEIGGTLVVEICVNALPRGVVRTNWLGGSAVPSFSLAYIKSRPWMTYGWSGT